MAFGPIWFQAASAAVLSFTSRFLNFVTGGSFHQTFCARAMRAYINSSFPGEWFWKWWNKTLDGVWKRIMGRGNHCWDQYLKYPHPKDKKPEE